MFEQNNYFIILYKCHILHKLYKFHELYKNNFYNNCTNVLCVKNSSQYIADTDFLHDQSLFYMLIKISKKFKGSSKSMCLPFGRISAQLCLGDYLIADTQTKDKQTKVDAIFL